MKKILLFVLILNSSDLFSQDSTESVNALYSLTIGASTPAFSILDLSPSTVERPKDPTDFAILLQTASENFSLVPKNFALEIAPVILYDSVKTFDEFSSTKLSDVLRQSFILSLATTTSANEVSKQQDTRFGVGFKVSFLRGKISDPIKSINKKIINMQVQFSKDRSIRLNRIINESNEKIDKEFDPEITELKKSIGAISSVLDTFKVNAQNEQEHSKLISEKNEKISRLRSVTSDRDNKRTESENNLKNSNKLGYSKEEQSRLDEIANEVSKIEFIRDGFKLDLSYAMAFDFADQNLSTGKLSKIGAWLTFGGDFSITKKGSSSVFGVVKFINTPYINDTNDCSCGSNSVNNIDAGLRVMNTFSNFSISAEYVYNFEAEQSKYLVDLGYRVGTNNLAVFSFGKEFNGSPYREGNLIAALNFIIGLGSVRPL